MRPEALAQLVDRQADLGTGWVPLQQVAHLLGWSLQQQRSQLPTLQHTLEAHPWYLALTQASTGPVVHAEDLRARAQQLTHGYRPGLA